ncbi:ketopantoate reductase PanE/ApbA C terminal-domain-containing protein [Boletus edulis BED1]|uniref:2-dehydropantoate 2-reductase n=1 Tax=Boletus edulis BED1 TaxID=1328754 RepID=A0AAD4C5X9_BOLED|nr:ketopantoate reductase PanE/ApbA C terminal-domain-containing protein [Boletus edulis BED1]
MRFYILGIGPIGSLLAHHLRAALPSIHSVTLIHKSVSQARTAASLGSAISVENQGIVETRDGFDMEVFEQGDCSGAGIPFDSTLSRDEVKCHSPPPENLRTDLIEALFVTTKAQNTTGAISRMLPRLTPRSTIVLLQNGMGIYEDLVEKLFRNPESRPHFIIASNTHGAWLKSPLHVVHAGVGDIEFGIIPDSRGRDFEVSLSDESKPLHERELSLDDIARQGEPYYAEYSSLRDTAAVLSSLDGLSCKWRRMSDVQLAMRKKLVVNSVVNPLTAILGCRNGALFKDGASKRMLHDICTEASAAFQAQLEADTHAVLGSLAPDAERSQAPLGRMPHELQADMLGQEVKRVAQLTRGNISSMLSDIRKGRPTEISFLNGYLVRLGKQYGVPMPVNSALLNMVNMRSAIPIDQLF